MSSPPRLTLSDLVTEYLLHKDRKHLYVEGREDSVVLGWYLKPLSDGRVCIFDIETVEITATELHRHGLNEGNKSRVLVLARELDRALPEDSTQVLCIVDADFDYILNRVEKNRFLAYTDGTSMDMYAFSETALERVIKLGMRDADSEPRQIMDNLYHVLRNIFITRAANESLKLGLEWLPYEKRCKIQPDGTISFDDTEFVRDYLSKNKALSQEGEFCRCRQALSEQSLGSRCRWVRGHDFGNLLTRYLRASGKTQLARKIAKGESVIRMLFVGLDRDEMRSAPLFRRITDFLA